MEAELQSEAGQGAGHFAKTEFCQLSVFKGL